MKLRPHNLSTQKWCSRVVGPQKLISSHAWIISVKPKMVAWYLSRFRPMGSKGPLLLVTGRQEGIHANHRLEPFSVLL